MGQRRHECGILSWTGWQCAPSCHIAINIIEEGWGGSRYFRPATILFMPTITFAGGISSSATIMIGVITAVVMISPITDNTDLIMNTSADQAIASAAQSLGSKQLRIG